MSAGDLVRAIDAENKHLSFVECRREYEQQLDRRRIGPLEVVHDNGGRASTPKRFEGGHERIDQRRAIIRIGLSADLGQQKPERRSDRTKLVEPVWLVAQIR